jgi:putative oxidoreductase
MWADFLEIGWLFPLVAVIEFISGLLFMIPKYRALGALLLFPVIVGIQLTHFTVYKPLIPMGLVLLAIHIWAIYENREKYLPLVK